MRCALGLPTTPVEIIDVSEDLIRLTPECCMAMARQRIPLQAGTAIWFSVPVPS